MFNNALTKVICHICIFTEALLSLIHSVFRLLSSLQHLRFSSHRGEFAAIMFGKDEVLPCANGLIVLNCTVIKFVGFLSVLHIRLKSLKFLNFWPFIYSALNKGCLEI